MMNLYPYTVYNFKMIFGDDVQERYVVAKTEDEALSKFESYLMSLATNGFAIPDGYSLCPTVEIDYVI